MKIRSFRVFVGIVTTFQAYNCVATPAPPFELEPSFSLADFMAVIRESTETSPRVLQAKAMVEQQYGARTTVRAGLFPQLEVRATAQASISRELSSDSTEQERLFPKQRVDAVASAQQLLTDFGATARQVNVSDLRLAANVFSAKRTVAEVVNDLAVSWIQYTAALARRRAVKLHLDRVSEIIRDTQQRERVGAGSGMDVARATSALSESRARLAEAEADVAAGLVEVDRLFHRGRPAEAGWPEVPHTSYATIEAASRAATVSAGMMAFRLNSRAAEREVDAVSAARFPQLTAGVQASRYELFRGGRDHDVRATIGFRQELVSSRILRGPLMQAKALAEAASAKETEQAQALEAASAKAFIRLDAARKAVEARKGAYDAAVMVRDMTVEQHRLARQSLLEVLRAETQALDAALALINATMGRDVAAWRLALETGALDGESGS